MGFCPGVRGNLGAVVQGDDTIGPEQTQVKPRGAGANTPNTSINVSERWIKSRLQTVYVPTLDRSRREDTALAWQVAKERCLKFPHSNPVLVVHAFGIPPSCEP